ncbi:MAG TPA: choice-of-anchor D domain-containing protein [Terracidiphilus sp.]|nr:choice-of-anchor D domain-containing protein [Terracidiphilus sp.]
MTRTALIPLFAIVLGIPIAAVSQTAASAFDFENQDGYIGGRSPLSTSVRLGQPKASITVPSVVNIQFYQIASGPQGPNYYLQAFSDNTYTIPVGNPQYPSNITDASGTPINLPSYRGIVNASVTGTFSQNLYYSLHFGCCDFSDNVVIRGDPSNTFTCTQVGGNGNCYDGYYSGPPYLLVDTDITNLTGLNQYETDGKTQIIDGGLSLSGTLIFAAALRSNDGSPLQLQVEVEPSSIPFTGQPSATSTAVTSSGTATVSISGLASGAYHWRARAVDSEGGQSLWQSLSMNSTTTDFVIPVPQAFSYFLGNAGPPTSSVLQYRGYDGSPSFTVPLGEWQGSTSLSAWYVGAPFDCANSGASGIALIQGTDANMDNASTIYSSNVLTAGGGFLYGIAPVAFIQGDFYQLIEKCSYNGSFISFVNSFNSGGSAIGGIATDSLTLSNALVNGTLPPKSGTISVTTNLLTATFTVVGPATFSGSGTSATFNSVPPGAYTIAFGPVAGYMTPSSPSQTLAAGGTLMFTGTYSPVSVAPNPVSFPTTYVGGTSPVQYVTVTNGSGVAVTMGVVTASPNFTENSSACVSILPGKSCRIAVKFQPGAAGPLTGTLIINETSPVGLQTVNLTGTGFYRVAVSPNPLPPFPDTSIGALSPTQCTTVTNNTSGVLAISAVSATANFAVDKISTTCSTSLAANSSCLACSQFKPTLLGAIPGTLNVSTGLGVQKVGLSGNGVGGGILASASSLSFPDTNVGATSAAQSITLTNETGGAVTMASVVAPSGFLVSANTCVSPIASGKSCRIALKFQPASAGSFTEALTISELASGTQIINLSGTGLNLVPTITREYPTSGSAGAPGFVINIYGSHFVNSSVVQWNGNSRPTIFVSPGQLQSQISSADISVQTTAYVTVANPLPGGGSSNQLAFAVQPGGIACTSLIVLDPSPADCYTALVEDTVDDPQPLGTRIPLILIHGNNGNTNDATGTDTISYLNRNYWSAFLNYFDYAAFQQKYKIYRFHYVSNDYSTWELGRSLRNQIDVLTSQDSNWDAIDPSTGTPKQIVIVAHSMGGLVAREFMNEHNTYAGVWSGQRTGNRVAELVTLATPHHGSPLANDLVRTEGTAGGFSFAQLWNPFFKGLDLASWGPWTWQSINETIPNRSDLRFDNFNSMWNSVYYIPREHNALLDKIDHTFDNKIVAYYGYISSNSGSSSPNDIDIGQLGQLLPGSLTLILSQRNPSPTNPTGNADAALNVVSVLQQRIWDANFDPLSSSYPITSVDNDGLVPKSSAAFDGVTIKGQVECPQYDHLQMRGDGAINLCDTGYPLLRSLVDTLGVSPPDGVIIPVY